MIFSETVSSKHDEGSDAMQTIEAAHLNLQGRKKVEICFPHNFVVTAFQKQHPTILKSID